MLNLFRQGGAMKVLMSAVVILIAAAFVFTSGGGGTGAAADECVVRVDTSCVAPKDYNFLLRLVPPPGTTNKQLKQVGFPQHAADALIERELLLKEARRLGIDVSEEDIDAQLAEGRVHFSWPVDAPLPQALFRGQPFPVTGALDPMSYIRVKNSTTDAFDYDIYKRQVRGLLRMSPKEFKQLQRDEIVAARVRGLVTSAVRVSEEEAFTQFELNRSRATVRYVEVKNSWFERFVGDLTDAAAESADKAAVDAAWESTKSKWTEGCPLVSEILLRFPPGADAEERAAQSTKSETVEKLLKDGVAFSTLARIYSDAPNAKSGGELGCLDKSYGAVAEELLKALDEMKSGEVSSPIETAQGFHILKFHGKLAKEEVETKGRLAAGRRIVVENAAKEAAKEFAASLITAAKGDKPLEDAVDEAIAGVSLPVDDKQREPLIAELKDRRDVPQMTISRAFNRMSISVPGLKDPAAVARQVFELEKDDQFVETPLESFAGQVVIQLKEKDLATREEFEEDKLELLRGLQEQKRADAISSYVSRLRKAAQRIEISGELIGDKSKSDDSEGETSETNSG